MAGDDGDRRQQVALFRFERIADLLRLEAGSKALRRRLRERAGQECSIPGTSRQRVSATTLRRWMARYRAGGLEALYPKPRSDRGRRRALAPELASLLVAIKEREPDLPVRKVIRRARREGPVPAAVRLAPTTVYRLLRDEGLMRRTPHEEASQDQRRWGYLRAGELWMSDVLHGPKIRCDRGGRRSRRKSYLIAFIDDATRVVPHAAFRFGESYADYLPVFKSALLKRGLPERLFVDNGSVYRCHHLRVVCASLNIQLLHSRAYHPAGKGKIERFFRTLRGQFLRPLQEPGRLDLERINRRLGAWLEGEYHQTPHGGLEDGRTPLQQWALTAGGMRAAGPAEELDELCRLRYVRRVTKDRVVQFQSRFYEVRAGLTGRKVTLLVDPAAPPERPIPVEFDGRAAGLATPLDRVANSRVRRAGNIPDKPAPAGKPRAAPPVPEPEAAPLRLTDLRPQAAAGRGKDPAQRPPAAPRREEDTP